MRGPEISWENLNDAPVLREGEVHVLVFALQATPDQISHFTTSLSEDEVVRANQFRFGYLRDRFIVGRTGLRIVLGRYLRREPSGLQFNYSERGKPSLASSNIQFNLAHSDELALLAVAKNFPVGVDVEKIRPMPDGLDIARRFFAASEVAAFGGLPINAHDEAFFNLWTRKEAWLKATGDGIAELLSKVEFTFRPGELPRVIAIDGDVREASEWSLTALQPALGFVGAVALRGQNVSVKCWHASF